MSTHNIHFHAEIRKISIPLGWKKNALCGVMPQCVFMDKGTSSREYFEDNFCTKKHDLQSHWYCILYLPQVVWGYYVFSFVKLAVCVCLSVIHTSSVFHLCAITFVLYKWDLEISLKNFVGLFSKILKWVFMPCIFYIGFKWNSLDGFMISKHRFIMRIEITCVSSDRSYDPL